ncbi:MAG: hypothetical protein AAB584_01020 [Patescibacteria group bacterium]
MKKEEMAAIAAQPGSEEGMLGAWPRARLDQTPNAGDLTQVNGNWYVAVAGYRREGTKGILGGLYARWVQVPKKECEGW